MGRRNTFPYSHVEQKRYLTTIVMINIADLITPERILPKVETASKKRALEALSQLIARDRPELSQQKVFESLIARERLGATGLGRGVALPHGRLENLGQVIGAFIRLEKGVDFDAIDKQPVDLLFALLVPVDSTDEHLQILATLAQMFGDMQLREQLRTTDSSTALFELLIRWQPRA